MLEVPATVANLGPGFDAVGVAIEMSTRVEFELTGDRVIVEHVGAWASALADAPTDGRNLLARTFLEACTDGAPTGVRITQHLDAPVGRGFGSSASAIVAGLVAADALGLRDPGIDLLARAVDIEGHPDNVSPCLLGGITTTAGETTIRIEPPAGWAMIVAIAPTMSDTAHARIQLPETFTRAQTADQAARSALLGFALGCGDLDALYEGTYDLLHQPTRFAAMPESAAIVASWRARGVAAFLSGAGPSVAGIVPLEDTEELAMELAASAPDGWAVLSTGLCHTGTRLLP